MKHSPTQRVSIVGLGHVGLYTAVSLASRGFDVSGVDIDKNKVTALSKGTSNFYEEGFDSLLRRSLRKKTLVFRSSYECLARSKIIFITVGTPSRDDGRIDPEYVESASREVGRQLAVARGYKLVVVNCAVTPGTTEGLVKHLLERESRKEAGVDFGLAFSAELPRKEPSFFDAFHPDAMMIGGYDRRSTNTLLRMYDAFYKRRPPTILTTPPNAEMMAYAISAGRATQVSFVNTIANYCTRVPGCDYDEVRKGLAEVGRMDEGYLNAGLGFGGSRLGRDCRTLAFNLKAAGIGNDVISATLTVNGGQVSEAVRLAEKLCGSLEGKKVALLGLAFKAGTDDIRESAAIALAKVLIRGGAEVTAFDPAAIENSKNLFGRQVTYAKSARDALRGSECAFIATDWDDFKRLRPDDFKSLMASPAVVDGRRIYNQSKFLRAGVRISTIGTGQRGEGSSWELEPSSRRQEEWHYFLRDGKLHSSGPAMAF